MKAVVFLLLVLAILGVVNCGCNDKKADTKAKKEGEKSKADEVVKTEEVVNEEVNEPKEQ